MRLCKPYFEIIEQSAGLKGIYKAIEVAGRVCYKSEDKITEDSAKGFVDRIVKSGHYSVLEHGTVYLHIKDYYNSEASKTIAHYTGTGAIISSNFSIKEMQSNPYSKCNIMGLGLHGRQAYITTNYRVLVENGWLDDLKYLCEPTEYHAKRITVHFICDRGILAEFTRHRTFSFAAESTRYCNYSLNKFGNEITFIKPCTLDDSKLALYGPYHTVVRDKSPESIFIASLNNAERDYLDLIKSGWKPQQARAVLLNALKTELVMTGFVDDWWGEYLVIDKATGLIDQRIHGKFWNELDSIDREKYLVIEKGFFPLRCSKTAHPSARELAIPLREDFIKRGYIDI